jgi:dipeptidyl aminopeptidase/acylaminoacyl peptidase
MRPGRLPELYTRTVDEAGATVVPETALTNMSADLADAAVELPESFAFMSNGDELTGYVVKPVGYEPGKKYPGILWVHGGPKCDMGNVFNHEIAYLSGLGYFVFYTNPHGAGGHGQKFAASIFGGLGQMDFQDLMTFTDQVLERYPDIDAEHLAEMGGSYGGFMTNWIIGHTDRFCCCNSQRSISNWVSMFGVSDIGYYFADDQTCGWPWDNVEAMWDQSPLKYADRARTPTLFLHADCDYRCPLEQGLQMYTALKVHDVPARLVVFKGENHELSRSGKPQARVRRLAEIANWYGVWLKGDPEGEPSLRG